MIEYKKKIIRTYTKNIDKYDLFCETYRGGSEKKLHLPLSYKNIFSKWEQYLSENPNGVVDLYIHIPFCLKICSYCNYYKQKADTDNVEKYILDYLLPYLEYVSKVFKGFKFNSLYIGGGTPSILSISLLEKLLSFINLKFHFIDSAERTFEGNPISLSKEKIEILSKNLINRVSMGVQTLNKNTLSKANREYQDLKIIKNVINNLNNFGISNINIDLLIGLDNEERDDFIYSLETFSKLKIVFITAYWLIPTDKYLSEYFSGDTDLFYKNLNKQVDNIHNALEKIIQRFSFFEYDISKLSNHCWQFKLVSYKTKTSYTDIGSNSILGIGPSSRSYINKYLFYSTLEYIPTTFDSTGIYNVGKEIDIYDEFIQNSIVSIRDNGVINTDLIKQAFKIDFKEKYLEEIFYLQNKKYINIIGNKVIFSDDIEKKYYSTMFLFSLSKLNIKNLINFDFNAGKYIHFFSKKVDLIAVIENSDLVFISKNKIDVNNILQYYYIIKSIKNYYEKFNKYDLNIGNFYLILRKHFIEKIEKFDIKLSYISKL